MKGKFAAAFAVICILLGACSTPAPAGDLVISPYLQLGDRDSPSDLAILWGSQTKDAGRWKLEYKTESGSSWTPAQQKDPVTLHPSGREDFLLIQAKLTGLKPAEKFQYRLSKDNRQVFNATAANRKSGDHSFAVFGDCGAGSSSQKALASMLFGLKPDMVMIPGDIVYDHGRVSEYLERFFSVYNADEASELTGAPLLRSVPFLSAPGNHDVWVGSHANSGNFNYCPDGMAYFTLWSQPLNGPKDVPAPPVEGSKDAIDQFSAAAGDRYPTMASYSFDYGPVHWTVLDANPYIDWLEPSCRAWLEADLKAAQKSRWRFVCFHQSAFHSGHYHKDEQQMRRAADLFEKYGVDVIFCGHVHNYQRTFPLRFKITPARAGAARSDEGVVPGEFTLDRQFDGVKDTTPEAPIYLLTGCGGAHIRGHHDSVNKASWDSFTCKYLTEHSVTFCRLEGGKLTVKQINAQGRELDRFVITKP